MLSIGLLGPPEVSFEGCALRFGRKKALELLCYLAVEGGKRSRRGLAELLWPQSDERRARTDLCSILARLRKTLRKVLRGGDERLTREEVRRFAERAETNERDRMSYLRSLAVLSEWEGDTKRATDHLYESKALSEEIGPPGELWQILARIGELHEQRGEVGEAWEAFSRAAQILRDLAAKIKDEGLREGFLAAPRVRRVLEY